MNTTDNWVDLVEQHWNKSPIRLSDATVLDLERTYEVLLAAVEPFLAGTRFRALPDVRFFLDGAQIAAPGDLLPGPADPTADQYFNRMGDRAYVLAVEQPLWLDFPLWSQVRDLVTPLWQRVGVPALPVISEISLLHNQELVFEPTHAALACVLHGTVQVDLEDESLRGAVGDLLYWPGGRSRVIAHGTDCVLLVLRIPVDRRLATSAVKDLITALLERRRGTDSVPYLPYPPPRNDHGVLPQVGPLADTRNGLSDISNGPDLERMMRAQWAKRVSAGGLEPVPSPRLDADDVIPGRQVRLSSDIVRMPNGGDDWIWAINGHAFSARGTAAEDVATRLRSGDSMTVGDDAMLPLLRKLYSLRAIDVSAGGIE